MCKWYWVLLFVCLYCKTYGDDSQDEEDMNYYLGRLYEDAEEETYDLHNMLKYPGQKEQPKIINKENNNVFGSKLKADNEDSCSFDKLKLEAGMEQLESCKEQLSILERNKESNAQKIRTLEKKLMSEGSVDMKAFYRRAIYHLWNVLKLKEAQGILKENEAVIRRLSVRISRDDVNVLQNFMDHENNVQRVDEFLQAAFILDDLPEESHGISIRFLIDWASAVLEIGKSVEVWLYVLCLGFILLGMWAVHLFIRDIQRELRWMRVITMMMVLVFFICCLWHWRHMHKVAESRRHATMMKRGFSNIPEECKPGAQGTTHSFWEWLKVRVFGAPDVCEKYYEELMIDPSEEITPAMVIAETLAKFFLQPLQHLGSESAKFITNFYQIVPVIYHIPATLFFLVLLIIILFAFCGYGIDFPLWMGGIRPIYKPEVADTSNVDRITKEAIAQLQSDRERFMVESRTMLSEIAQAATSSQVQAGIQPLMMMSSSIIQSQLERLIAHQFSNVISQNIDPDLSRVNSVPQQQDLSLDNRRISTVTSTPLKRHYKQETESPHFDHEDVRDGVEEETNETTAPAPGALMAATDAVHYRLSGSQRKKSLPPKDGRNDSSSSASSRNDIGSPETKSKVYIENKSGGSSSTDISMDNTSSVVRRRAIGQSSDHSSHSSSPSEPSSNQSLNEANREAFLSDVTSSGGNFLNRVKTILEDSANSSIHFENSDVSVGDDYGGSRRMTRSLTASQVESNEDEVELSASGVKFLSKIEKVMTP